MTKSTANEAYDAPAAVREPRPFLLLSPARLPVRTDAQFAAGARWLDAAAGDAIPAIVRSLVDYTIALQNKRALERGNPQPIALSVLNRRRRAARSWLLAILAGKVDSDTLHAVGTQWLPTLTGTGPEIGKAKKPARQLIEFVRGAITACIFDEPAANLLPHAHAAHVLETTLGAHLAALLHAADTIAV